MHDENGHFINIEENIRNDKLQLIHVKALCL